MDNLWYFMVGFTAQILFSSRVIVQWMISEKEKKVVSPTIYWQLSLLASFLFLLYGWLRGDFSIILGQFLSYYIYIWNLKIKDYWKKLYSPVRILILLVPFFCLTYLIVNGQDTIERLFAFEDISLGLLLFGSAGQLIFTLRFIYQWQYSRMRHKSLLPVGFWMLSIIGSFIIIIYGIFRHDPVLIIGHGIGLIIYMRNLWLLKKEE